MDSRGIGYFILLWVSCQVSVAVVSVKFLLSNIRDLDKTDVIMLGDLNWNAGDLTRTGSTFIEEIILEFAYRQLINCPTRVGLNSRSKID